MEAIEIPLASLHPRRDVTQSPRVGITTMGCKVNTYESEFIAATLKTDQWRVVPATETADLYIINTCTVTREADRQARQEVRRAINRNPDALVVVTGCYAQMDAEACAAIPGVDLVLGNDRKLDIHSPAAETGRGQAATCHGREIWTAISVCRTSCSQVSTDRPGPSYRCSRDVIRDAPIASSTGREDLAGRCPCLLLSARCSDWC